MSTSDEQWTSLYKYLLGGACIIILALAGLALGVWSHSMESALDEIRESQRSIWRTLAERSSLPGRTTELEKRTDDQERRLRDLEIINGRHRH